MDGYQGCEETHAHALRQGYSSWAGVGEFQGDLSFLHSTKASPKCEVFGCVGAPLVHSLQGTGPCTKTNFTDRPGTFVVELTLSSVTVAGSSFIRFTPTLGSQVCS